MGNPLYHFRSLCPYLKCSGPSPGIRGPARTNESHRNVTWVSEAEEKRGGTVEKSGMVAQG